MKGRKPKPTILKMIRGTQRKCRINPSEPKLQPTLPPCPAGLVGAERDAWEKIGDKLLASGLVTELDEMGLFALCRTWGQYVEASEKAAATGMLIKAPSGYPMINPYITAANALLKRLQSLLSEFGLTPSSRSRVRAGAPPSEDEGRWKEYAG